MSVGNIVDRRDNQYNVEIDAVFEPSWHDNSCSEATNFMQLSDSELTVDHIDDTTVEDAIKHCDTWDLPVTLYLYDKGADPMGFTGEDENFVDPIEFKST